MFPPKSLKNLRILSFSLIPFQSAILSSAQIKLVKAPGCESDGEGYMSNHHNLSIFTSTAPISLTVCLPWQRLFSDQLRVALASAPSLYSAHSGCIPCCCQPSRPVPVAKTEREKEGWMEREGRDSRRQRTSGRRKFSLRYEENF